MSHGFHSRNLTFPVPHLTSLLLYDTEEHTLADCKACGLSVQDKGVVFNKTVFKSDAKVRMTISMLSTLLYIP
jgi:hypothetical protein